MNALPSGDDLANETRQLYRSRPMLAMLLERGIPLSIIDDFELGFDGQRITIPIRDRDGQLVNVRRYKKTRTGQTKMLNTSGFGSPTRLAFLPTEPDLSDWIVVGGGEWDALSAIAFGFQAVCGTNGEGALPIPEDLELLAGARVAIALDNDGPGRASAQKWRAALKSIAEEVVVMTLPGEGTDLNDWIRECGSKSAFDGFIKAAQAGVRRPMSELLHKANAKVSAGESRNGVALWLAAQARDERYSQEETWDLALAPFQSAVDRDDAPFPEREARQVLQNAWQQPARKPSRVAGARTSFALTESGNAERLIAQHGDRLKYVAELGTWLVWDGVSWKQDATNQVPRWAKESARAMNDDAAGLDEESAGALKKWAHTSESAQKLTAAVQLARNEVGVQVPLAMFDADPMLLNLANGVLDLATGQLRTQEPNDLLRKVAPVHFDASAQAPLFQAFLERVQPDPDVRAFLQRAIGYSLTGHTTEQKMFLLLGPGANGKSTFIELINDMLGLPRDGYSVPLTPEALVDRPSEGIPSDIARLEGARFVPVNEFKRDARFNERRVKQLTGGDTVSARFLHKDFFDFRPQGKLWLSSNYPPIIHGADDGIWRRFVLVAFNVRIPEAEQDRTLASRLRDTELSGVLNWALEGLAAYLQDGLGIPKSVAAATSAYRKDSDLLGQFFEDRCVLDLGLDVSKGELFREYKAWCADTNNRPVSDKGLHRMILEHADLAVEERRVGKNRVHTWFGVGLLRDVRATPGHPHLAIVPQPDAGRSVLGRERHAKRPPLATRTDAADA